MIIKNIDSNGNNLSFEAIENLVLSNEICNKILSSAIESIGEDSKNEGR